MTSTPRGPRVQYNAEIRELLRERGEPIPQDVKLQERDGCIRATLMATAFDDFEEIPDVVRQWYDPHEHAIVIPLPEPDRCDESLDDF